MADQRGAIDALVLADLHGDVRRALDDVAVGRDQAVGADEKAGADAAHWRLAGATAAARAVHSLEEVVKRVIVSTARRRGHDADDRRHRGVHQRRNRNGWRGGPFLGGGRIGPQPGRGRSGQEQRESERHAGERGYAWPPAQFGDTIRISTYAEIRIVSPHLAQAGDQLLRGLVGRAGWLAAVEKDAEFVLDLRLCGCRAADV